jgi:hypothetical protein
MERGLRESGIPGTKIKIRFNGDPDFPYHCDIDRSRETDFTLHLTSNPDKEAIRCPKRILSVLHALAKSGDGVRHIDFNMSDGDQPSPARFAYCGSDPDLTLLPDSYFFNHRGFVDSRVSASAMPQNWQSRSGRIRWRGALNGKGETDIGRFALGKLVPRISLILLCRTIADVDAKFVRLTGDKRQVSIDPSMFAERLPESSWLNDRYAIDIDGWTNTWSNFLVRMHYGCCVLKIESRYGYRQWYYDRIRPWQHFVPVKADMSDLAEKIDWVRSNAREAEDIAMHGQAFARTMTFESEMECAANAIRNRIVGN